MHNGDASSLWQLSEEFISICLTSSEVWLQESKAYILYQLKLYPGTAPFTLHRGLLCPAHGLYKSQNVTVTAEPSVSQS
jgi:hypothetical protein